MFDVIGKRNWFFAFSLLITIPGLIFILLGPVTGGKVGLQFAIDFTGGTVWTIRFEDAERHRRSRSRRSSPARASTPRSPKTGDGLHRDPDQGGGARRTGAVADAGPDAPARRRPPAPSASARPRLAVGRSRGSPGIGRPPAPARRRRRPQPRRRARAASAASRAARIRLAVAPRRSRAGAVAGSDLPTTGKLGEVARRARGGARARSPSSSR